MTNIVVGDALGITQSHGHHRLGTVEGLNLAFFIHAQYQRIVRWIQIQAHDVTHFLDEKRINRELEARLRGKG